MMRWVANRIVLEIQAAFVRCLLLSLGNAELSPFLSHRPRYWQVHDAIQVSQSYESVR
jgi:hypothetical protein